ncbi:MAG: polysaccharide pyruvyl transferase family protein [Fusobacterium sp.]
MEKTKIKKIGILTFHYPETMNYGAILQTYASMKKIKGLGYEVEIINYKKITSELEERFGKEGKNFKKFQDKYLKITSLCETNKKLKELNNKFDIFIVGSDQVWRAGRIRFNLKYFLNFVSSEKKKVAYAVSFGLDKWKGNFVGTYFINKLVKKFDCISVREESGVDICKKIFGVESVCVLDPTLILPREEYQPILDEYKDKSHLKKKYIAHMLLDDDDILIKYSKKIADRLKCKINYIKGSYRNSLGEKTFIYNGVGQWLTYLKDSELVITDSFHCTVFSIIFHKKFLVVANPKRGNARLENLLKIVGLEDRFFTDIKDVENSGILEKEINYETVEKRLDVKRKYSIDFLKNALGDN